ncbi:MAG: phage regulatory protein/antirepressor Ant, partial [Tetragenococcus koreensis]|nr:phage regulatory protein/antirepressor Ant [Tetragenococcus koreensis]
TVAEELKREHKNVKRDLEQILISSDLSALILESDYKDIRGRKQTEYLLTKDGFILYMFNIQGHNDFKMAYINKFNEMEKRITVKEDSYMIDDPVERAKRWIEEAEQRKQLETDNVMKDQIIGELQPKADYVDKILESTGTMTITQIAADYGLTAQKLNKLLKEAKLQRQVGKQWVLYANHMNKGYTKSHTINITRTDGSPDTMPQTRWTQKGRLKIHDVLTELGYEAQLTEI